MLTFATFAQQAVKISLGTNRVDFKTATVRRAKLSTGSLHFDDHFYPLVERGNETILASQGLVPQEIVKAMYSGMIAGRNTLSDVVGHCPGDYCTWEEHRTLAVCSSLEDLSSSVYSLNPFDTDYTEMSVRELDPAPDFVNGTRSSFWTATRNASTVADDQGEDKDHRKLAETGIADIFVGYFPPCAYNSDELWSESREDPKRWKAHRATLEYCLHTIKPTSNSSMETKIIETKKDLKWEKDEKNPRYCHTENGEDFCVRDSWQMARQLDQIFNGMGSYWSVDNGDNYYKGPWTLFLTNDILGDNVSRCDTDPNLGFAGFQRRMDNVAVAITNELRRGEATGETVRGEVFNNRQYFRMQLYWLSVPGVLYVVTTLLLFGTIFRTASQETPIWKSSALVLLRCMDRENNMNYLDEVEDKARNTAVELKYTGENWYLQNTTG
ncbi:hypothetical protein BS50DRAFT_397207 [Corynespora cassiicola Philippines]|uniref:Uncharacterized protein n=1 Tax=Corynespora cassiicola Philippines TaxID=1448308 RepID=A0A2T2NJY9_CORCC|nr:hypothetical protein BS50DRAFT_397207 [Corynespora cassiicola Philippines]